MANPEHVRIVERGAAAIAGWCKAHPGERMDLRGTYLQLADLEGADLQRAHLRGAHLEGAHLRDADLRDAHLRGTDFRDAHLEGARLQRAFLQGAKLTQAFCMGADFSNFSFDTKTKFDGMMIDDSTKGLGAWLFNPEKYIIREIEFPPEYHQAGVGIMHSFSTVLRQKYPNIPATVQITQEELTVRMTIETEEGHREIIEQTLGEYSLVVSGKMQPEEFSSDPMELAELKSELSIARVRIENQQNLLQIRSDQVQLQESQIKSQETQIQLLGSLLEKSFSQPPGVNEAIAQSQELTKLLGTLVRQISRQQNQAVTQAFATLQEQLNRKDEDVDEPAMTRALDMLKEYAPAVYNKIKTYAEGTIVGVTGNFAYSVLQRYFG